MCHIESAPGAPCHDKLWENSSIQKLSQSMLRLSAMVDMGKMCGFWVRGFLETFYITATIRNQGILGTIYVKKLIEINFFM